MVTWWALAPLPKLTCESPMAMVRSSVVSAGFSAFLSRFLMTTLPVPACTASLKAMTKSVSLATLVAPSSGLKPLVASIVGAVVSDAASIVSESCTTWSSAHVKPGLLQAASRFDSVKAALEKFKVFEPAVSRPFVRIALAQAVLRYICSRSGLASLICSVRIS